LLQEKLPYNAYLTQNTAFSPLQSFTIPKEIVIMGRYNIFLILLAVPPIKGLKD
jgi:hypothetical protein